MGLYPVHAPPAIACISVVQKLDRELRQNTVLVPTAPHHIPLFRSCPDNRNPPDKPNHGQEKSPHHWGFPAVIETEKVSLSWCPSAEAQHSLTHRPHRSM